MDYPTLVAMVGEDNTPPGGLHTVAYWFNVTQMDSSAFVLDLCCSTGFSSRYLHLLSGCHGAGIDLCKAAVRKARLNLTASVGRKHTVPITYELGDACHLPFLNHTFTDVIVGSSFGFIANRELALAELVRVLQPAGRLMSASFHFNQKPPRKLLADFERLIGYTPDVQHDRRYWSSFFRKRFRRIATSPIALSKLNEAEIRTACRKLIKSSASREKGIDSEMLIERFTKVRLLLNELRDYQSAQASVWQLE